MRVSFLSTLWLLIKKQKLNKYKDMDNCTISVSINKDIEELSIIGFSYLKNFTHYLETQCAEFDVVRSEVDDLDLWHSHSQTSRQPAVIFIAFELIQQENGALLKFIRQNEALQHIPIIAIYSGEKPSVEEQKLLIRAGLDDCYSTTVSWEVLSQRIAFLQEFNTQKQLLNFAHTPASQLNYYWGKRLFDIFFSSIAIIALSPIFLLIAAAIKLESKGPIIYYSKRAGMGYKVFNFYKFRSMYQDADQRLKDLQHLNQYSEQDEENCFMKIKNDPRITKVGRLIRKTSLDELPQLFNVLMGDMSVVGNRPLPLYEATAITRNEWVGRFLAPAGITGLWQVTKRGKDNMSTQERIGLDLEYTEKVSLAFDLKIILKTFPAMLQHENV